MLPTEIGASVHDFEAALAKVEILVAMLQAQPWAAVCGPETPPLDSARLHLMIAYAANSLLWVYLRTQGAKAQHHPVKAELERIKVALRKVKEAEASGDVLEDKMKLYMGGEGVDMEELERALTIVKRREEADFAKNDTTFDFLEKTTDPLEKEMDAAALRKKLEKAQATSYKL